MNFLSKFINNEERNDDVFKKKKAAWVSIAKDVTAVLKNQKEAKELATLHASVIVEQNNQLATETQNMLDDRMANEADVNAANAKTAEAQAETKAVKAAAAKAFAKREAQAVKREAHAAKREAVAKEKVYAAKRETVAAQEYADQCRSIVHLMSAKKSRRLMASPTDSEESYDDMESAGSSPSSAGGSFLAGTLVNNNRTTSFSLTVSPPGPAGQAPGTIMSAEARLLGAPVSGDKGNDVGGDEGKVAVGCDDAKVSPSNNVGVQVLDTSAAPSEEQKSSQLSSAVATGTSAALESDNRCDTTDTTALSFVCPNLSLLNNQQAKDALAEKLKQQFSLHTSSSDWAPYIKLLIVRVDMRNLHERMKAEGVTEREIAMFFSGVLPTSSPARKGGGVSSKSGGGRRRSMFANLSATKNMLKKTPEKQAFKKELSGLNQAMLSSVQRRRSSVAPDSPSAGWGGEDE